MIECKLLLMEKNKFIENSLPCKKYGHYMTSSFYSVKGFGRTSWVIVANILVDYDHYLEKGMTIEEVALRCVEPQTKKQIWQKAEKKASVRHF